MLQKEPNQEHDERLKKGSITYVVKDAVEVVS